MSLVANFILIGVFARCFRFKLAPRETPLRDLACGEHVAHALAKHAGLKASCCRHGEHCRRAGIAGILMQAW